MRKTLLDRVNLLVFILPTLCLFTAVVFIPIMSTVYHSFFNWDGLSAPIFNGLHNYFKLFADPLFYTSMQNVVLYTVVLVVYQVCFSSLFAVLLSLKWVKGRTFMRTTLFFPVVLSVTVVCQLWSSVFNGQYGLLNQIFELFGMSFRQAWLSDSTTAIYIIAFVDSWQYMGYYLVIIYTAMQSIPKHLYEAAQMDGANTSKQYFKITFPLLKDTYKLCFTLTVTGGLKAFQNMYIMTGGGPGTSTYTLTYMMYRSAFRINQFGYACTSATVLVIECLIITVIINKLMKSETLY
ncbi:carbohydrate ABC transporter permease [Caproicibacter fermentans]|uniref:Sugar ABC transporter permease n=1 Tax=Caproicibacter fermentans TaxID=2576756 RepID=A0A7G8T647_9FIRM|nr:sugar ABC transporter permease [Caproicibacter fermentans]QNK39088.1 sugar ABC transporter permease [Caproicibacter fermentans]